MNSKKMVRMIIKVNDTGEKLWDKTITGPGCILQAKLFWKPGHVGIVFMEECGVMIAVIADQWPSWQLLYLVCKGRAHKFLQFCTVCFFYLFDGFKMGQQLVGL